MKNEVVKLTNLPPELLLHCFSLLNSAKDLVSLSKTNHKLRNLALDQRLWQNYSHLLPKAEVTHFNQKGRPLRFTAFAELENGYLASGDEKKLWILETKNFKYVKKINLPNHINTLVALPTNRLAIGYKNGKIEICKLIFIKNKKPTKKQKIRAGSNKYFNLVRVRTIKIQKKHDNYCQGIIALANLANGLLASNGCCDNSIYIWNIDNGECVQKFRKNKYQVSALTVLTNGKLASGCNVIPQPSRFVGCIRIWDIENGKCVRVLQEKQTSHSGIGSDIKNLLALPNNKLAIHRHRLGVQFYETTNGNYIGKITANPSKLAILPNGHLACWSFGYDYISIWNINTGKVIDRLILRLNSVSVEEPHWHCFFSHIAERGDIIVLNDGRLVCGKSNDGIHVFRYPSIPENRLA